MIKLVRFFCHRDCNLRKINFNCSRFWEIINFVQIKESRPASVTSKRQTIIKAKNIFFTRTSFLLSSFTLPTTSVWLRSSHEKFYAKRTGKRPYPITKFALVVGELPSLPLRWKSVLGWGRILFPTGRYGISTSLNHIKVIWNLQRVCYFALGV